MVHGHTVAAVIVAAGASRRMGFDKLAYQLDGGTVLEKSVRAFDTHPAIDEILLVAGENAPQAALLAAALCQARKDRSWRCHARAERACGPGCGECGICGHPRRGAPVRHASGDMGCAGGRV